MLFSSEKRYDFKKEGGKRFLSSISRGVFSRVSIKTLIREKVVKTSKTQTSFQSNYFQAMGVKTYWF